MLNAVATQFKLGDDGVIRYQSQASNPLPGAPVAQVKKGSKILEPGIAITDAQGQDEAAVKNFLNEWLKAHVRTVLEPLVALEQTENLAEPVKGICAKLYDALGIVPREEVESLTSALDPEMRQVLRNKNVRLGPILVFMPALNKPAGVRLRGLLWSLWSDKPLPPPLPHDGVVSFKVDETADRDFYRAIGYPVYGPRAIRIDMLDRVISAVYDSAKEGKFQAQHKMAEWLGCQIDDLYGVLTAMGHRKISEPEPKKEEVAEVKPEEVKPEEKLPEGVVAAPAAKPELATFALKKGKAFEKREPKPKSEFKSKKSKAEKKKFDKKSEQKPERPKFAASAQAKIIEDSPFAILGQLKGRKDAS